MLGSQVCYGDFEAVAFMESLRRIGQDLYDRFVAHDEALERLMEACKPWLERDQ